MHEKDFLSWNAESDSRYHPNAYSFVLESLRYTQSYFRKTRHVTGQELLIGITHLGRQKYGYLTWTVFQEWGIESSRDFGNIVFNLVELGEIKKTADDRIEDFDNGIDLQQELEKTETLT